MPLADLSKFADERGLNIKPPAEIAAEATAIIRQKYLYKREQVKEMFDRLLDETQQTAYDLYLDYEASFRQTTLRKYSEHLIKSGEISDIANVGSVLAGHFEIFDNFYSHLEQLRRSIQDSIFDLALGTFMQELRYPLDKELTSSGLRVFVMPSILHYHRNPIDCIMLISKRDLQNGWHHDFPAKREPPNLFVVSIDAELSEKQLTDSVRDRITIICPERIRHTHYSNASNVISFTQFFIDYADPATERWIRNKVA